MPKYPDSPVPPSTEAPAGMQVLYADRTNAYAGYYRPNVEYARVNDQPLVLQMLVPEHVWPGKPAVASYPLIVYVQGSAWRKQDVYMTLPQLCDFVHRGYVVASVQYRPSDDAKFPAQAQDVKAAIRFLRAHAVDFAIDPDRVAVWGDSSGGHTALMVGMTEGDAAFDFGENLDQSSAVQAVVDFYGPTDMPKMFEYPRSHWALSLPPEQIPENMLFGADVKRHPELAQPGNPLNYVTAERKLPPMLIMHGDEDELVPFNQSVILYEKLVACGQSAQFYKVQGGMHGHRFWTRQVLDTVADFLRAHV